MGLLSLRAPSPMMYFAITLYPCFVLFAVCLFWWCPGALFQQ